MKKKLIITLSRDERQPSSLIYLARCTESDYPLPGGYGIEDAKDAVRQFILDSIPAMAKYGVIFPDVFLNNPTLEFIVKE